MTQSLSGSVYLGGQGIGAFGSIIGAGLNGLLNASAAETAYHHQRDLMNLQAKLNYKYAKKSTLNQYQWQRQGLENANFNPMLALQGAEGVANTGWTAGQSVQPADFSGVTANAAAIFDQVQKYHLNRAQVSNLGSQTNLNNATAETEYTKANLNNAESMLKMLQFEGQSIENRLKSVDLNWREVNYFKDYLKTLSDIERNTIQNTSDMINANAHYNSVQGQLQLFDKQCDLLIEQKQLTKQQAEAIKRQLSGMTFDQIKDVVKSVGAMALTIYFARTLPAGLKNIVMPSTFMTNPAGVMNSINFNVPR